MIESIQRMIYSVTEGIKTLHQASTIDSSIPLIFQQLTCIKSVSLNSSSKIEIMNKMLQLRVPVINC